MGFEPTPTFVDQNTHPLNKEGINLESGALDHSANLTYLLCNEIKYIFIGRFQSVSHRDNGKNRRLLQKQNIYCQNIKLPNVRHFTAGEFFSQLVMNFSPCRNKNSSYSNNCETGAMQKKFLAFCFFRWIVLIFSFRPAEFTRKETSAV